MHINVREILAESVGARRRFKITGERPALEHSRLLADLEGEFEVSRLESGLLVFGRVSTEVELQCDRCLRLFAHPVSVKFRQVFTDRPVDDEQPVKHPGSIDLAPVIDQEIILSLPIKILCRPDCPGITTPSSHNKQTKGSPRGRTQTTY